MELFEADYIFISESEKLHGSVVLLKCVLKTITLS